MAQVRLLQVVLGGEIVAEADLIVHDQRKAWGAFLNAYPDIAHLVAGELLQTMRTACDPVLLKSATETGIVIDLEAP